MQEKAALDPEQNPNLLEIVGTAIPVNVGPGFMWTVSGPGVLMWGWVREEVEAPAVIRFHVLQVLEMWRENLRSGHVAYQGLVHVPRVVIRVDYRIGIRHPYFETRWWTPWGNVTPEGGRRG